MSDTIAKPVVLTGDRTTGPLHLGHHAGSLRNRVALQADHEQYLLLADSQALTDNAHDAARVRANVLEVALDYLAVGIDPKLSTICVQSHLPALAELTMLLMNLVTVARLERNPTIREEIRSRGFEESLPAGFLCYPVAQAADILSFKATIVPVGADQLPMIEQSNECARRVNALCGSEVLPHSRAMTSGTGRLPGHDGKGKASKSAGNALALGASEDEVNAFVDLMYTDPDHVRVADPGRVEGNVVFAYLSAFDPDQEGLDAMKERYARGGLGDVACKRRLKAVLGDMLVPIRERRAALAMRPDDVMDVLREGTRRGREVTTATLDEVRSGFGLFDLGL